MVNLLMRPQAGKPLQNALSIDVEEYFQVTGFERTIARKDWETIPSRLHVGLSKVLQILDQCQVKATFFFLGWIAERYPDTVKMVADGGHEIGLHGYDHQLIYHQSPHAFEEDLSRTLAAVKKVYNGPILGYRAPSFSITEDTLWALEIIKKLGLKYDSSIFPFKRKRYGIANSPTKPYQVADGLWEVPMTTVQVLGKAIPVGGGGYFRLYPYTLTQMAIRHLNQTLAQPAIVYLHPWELDPDQPMVQADFGNTFRHRVNLDKTEKRLSQLCSEFSFVPIQEILGL